MNDVLQAANYTDFVTSKLRPFQPMGREPGDLHPSLFPFQSAIVRWACRMGRAALFEDCGLGKSRQQVEWLRHMAVTPTGPGRGLIFAPLTVAEQTVEEARAIGVDLRYVGSPAEMDHGNGHGGGLYITNYERHQKFWTAHVDAIVLDESSILKSVDGKTRQALLQHYQHVPYRLCCTATPAPNDIAEIANHSEFLGVKTRQEMLATYFLHDANGWRLKRHATGDFYRWLASWAVYVRKPSDLGYSDEGYDLPALEVRQSTVDAEIVPDGFILPIGDAGGGIVKRAQLRRETLVDRVAETVRLVNAEPGEQWIVWCGLNDESDAVARALRDYAVQVEGKTSTADKIERLGRFVRGEARVLVTKPTVCGFGLNFQHCARMVFCGIGDSWEQYYQCLRRCWRFGQRRDVHAWIVTSSAEQHIVANVMSKEEAAKTMGDQIIANIGELERHAVHQENAQKVTSPLRNEQAGPDWRLIHGDCVEALRTLDEESVHLSVFSPPFATLYTYSDDPRDMGNSADHEQFFSHFRFLVRELLRVTMPGRIACVHVAQVATTLNTHGVIGLTDFRGRCIQEFVDGGWVYYREVAIDKCPQAQAIRTHSKALLFVQKNKDRSWSGPALADFILVFRRPGDNPVPINSDEVDNETWIQWARPIWYGIKETDTLNVAEARGDKDERHICPLQLETIERCVRLWSNPGELVLSPFAGIGSEGFQSVKLGRRFIGVELKREYYEVACRNLRAANAANRQTDLFDPAFF